MKVQFKFIFQMVLRLVLGRVGVKCFCNSTKYAEDHIVPEIIPKYPQGELKVLDIMSFGTGRLKYESINLTGLSTPVKFGEYNVVCASEIARNLTEYQPKLDYLAKGTAFHTLAMIDPDAPEPQRPVFAQYVHWVVMNIPGVKVDDGKVLASYMPPSPPPYSSAHRYLLLIYEQPSYIFGPDDLGTKGRTNFNVTRFAENLQLGTPMAGTYFFVKHSMNAA